MQIQKSFENVKDGKLYIVPTPIGNMEDMTFRAIKTLNEVDVIAAEDTRHTKKLLNHFDISTRMISYHQHNEKGRTEELIKELMKGVNIALVSDAGMPVVSDPGYQLINSAITNDIDVIVLPGANAALCALVGSGLPTENFLFYGFLPRKKGLFQTELKNLSKIESTVIFYESPFRLKQTLEGIQRLIGDRKVVIAREITKLHEEYIRGNVMEIIDWLENNQIKGECCIVLEGFVNSKDVELDKWWQELAIDEHVEYYEKEKQLTHKESLKKVALDREITKREVYAYIHVGKNKM